jgi:hypothetical protein
MNSYPIETLVQVNGNFFATGGTTPTPVDPTTVSITLTAPDETVTVSTYPADQDISNPGVGQYTYQFVVSQTGVWSYRWQGEGAVIAASQNGFLRGI